jgi:hypothetical protein
MSHVATRVLGGVWLPWPPFPPSMGRGQLLMLLFELYFGISVWPDDSYDLDLSRVLQFSSTDPISYILFPSRTQLCITAPQRNASV